MASLKSYATTAKDVLRGKVKISDAIRAGKENKGGVIRGGQSANIKINWGGSDKKDKKPQVAGDRDEKNGESDIKEDNNRLGGALGTKVSKSSSSKSSSSKSSSSKSSAERAEKEARKAQEVAEREERKRIEAAKNQINTGWDNANMVYGETEKGLNESEGKISTLGEVRDKFTAALENFKNRSNTAIAGNKEMIDRNQKSALDDLAENVRDSIFNANLMLGTRGASGGSASRAVARAITKAAGKNRANTLTQFGDQMSAQNQEATKVRDRYELGRKQAYDWEARAREEAIREFAQAREALNRLGQNREGWKKADLDALNDQKLQALVGTLSDISNRARNFRENLANKYGEYDAKANEMEGASIDITPPSELDTPLFDENINFMEEDNQGEDWYNPNHKGKRAARYDIYGNPIFDEEEEELNFY